MYKTQNFRRPQTWAKRIIPITIFFIVAIYFITRASGLSALTSLIFFILYIGMITGCQIDELTINDENVIIEQKSIIPFFRSKKVIEISRIKSLKEKSDQVSNERGWLFYSKHNKNILEINLIDGSSERISGSLHPEGINHIKAMIEKNMQAEN